MSIQDYLKRPMYWCVLTIFAASFFAGCATEESQKQDLFFDKWRVRAETAQGNSPTARKRTVAIPKKISEPARQSPSALDRPLPNRKTTLEMQNTDIAVLLRALARAVGQDIMINESVKGRISINVKEAPWDQVFKGILHTNGLSYGWQGDIIHIISMEDQDRNLRQLETEKEIISKRRELEMVEPLFTQIVRVDYADAAKLKENLEKFLSEKGEGEKIGSVMVDEHNNALIIQAIRSDILRMIPLIEDLDHPTPQILIEAHIVEAGSETARELGIQWGGLGFDGTHNWITAGANSTGITGQTFGSGTGIDPTAGQAANFPAPFSQGSVPNSAAGLTIGYIYEKLGETLLSVQLSALQEDGMLNILSSPSITTVDNQKAIIEAGDEVPFQTVEDGEVKIEYKKAVLSLEVTPHVIDDNSLRLSIHTKKDELDFTRTVAGNPTVITKNAQTNVILFDGQTTVIGGLNKETQSDGDRGIPFLKDIPLFGYLFKGESKRDSMEEVLIFITPHILDEKIADANQPEPISPGAPKTIPQ
jgi:type IV pilus secretin PilQ/predicted competence protein